MSTPISDLSPSSKSLVNNPQSVSTLSAISTDRPSANAKKIPYQDTVQAHYLDLEAEIELLLQHLQSLSQQQLAATSPDKDN